MLRRAGIIALAAALGAGSATGVAACGEKRGSVSIEDSTNTSTSPTSTSPTETSTSPTETTTTSP